MSQRTVVYPEAGNKVEIEVGRTDKVLYMARYLVVASDQNKRLVLEFEDLKLYKRDGIPI